MSEEEVISPFARPGCGGEAELPRLYPDIDPTIPEEDLPQKTMGLGDPNGVVEADLTVAPNWSEALRWGSFISPNFSVTDLLETDIVEASGLTVEEIYSNVVGLTKNVLEPLFSRYGYGFQLQSVYRISNNQHGLGCAADITFPTLPWRDGVHRAEAISRLLPNGFDRIVLECHSELPIFHISYVTVGVKNRNEKFTSYAPAATPIYKGFRDRNGFLIYE